MYEEKNKEQLMEEFYPIKKENNKNEHEEKKQMGIYLSGNHLSKLKDAKSTKRKSKCLTKDNKKDIKCKKEKQEIDSKSN